MADAPPWKPRYNPWVVALTVTLATFMEVLDTSIANALRCPTLRVAFRPRRMKQRGCSQATLSRMPWFCRSARGFPCWWGENGSI